MKSNSIAERLKELHDLYKSGTLTKDEYESLKRQIISDDGMVLTEKEMKPEDEYLKSTNKPVQNPRSKKIWILAISSLSIIVIVLVLLKTGLFPLNSSKEYMINGKKVSAALLPPAGTYESNGNLIKVIIIDGKMSFDQIYSDGTRNDNFGDFDCDEESGLILVMGSHMWTLEYKGNGILEETMNGASTNNPPIVYKKIEESGQ